MSPAQLSLAPGPHRDRRQQIRQAAMVCFARRGFHQTTMQDIAAEADVSVGLIYRYFPSKEAVIADMAREHKQDLALILAEARSAPTLFDGLRAYFTCHCDEQPDQVLATFVVDLFAECGRNAQVRALVREINQEFVEGVTDLIANSAEAALLPPGFTPHRAAELLVDTMHGLMMRDVTELPELDVAVARERQVAILSALWTLLFPATVETSRTQGAQP